MSGSVVLRTGPIVATMVVGETGVSLRIERDERVVFDGIRLGITVAGTHLDEGSALLRQERRDVEETWVARSGKARGTHTLAHREAVATLTHAASGHEWEIRLRVSAEGVAVRYALPVLQGLSRLDADRTLLPLDGADRAWVLDYQTWYETPRVGIDVADLAPGDYGFPFLARTRGGDQVLVTESGIDGRFSGAHAAVVATPASRALGFALAEPTEIARGAVTPWRVFVIGDLTTVVESRFVDELAPAVRPELVDADWVRPGRAAWSWWSDFYSGAQLHRQQHFVDVAAQLGWEHLLIDCGWEETWVPEIVAYASLRGIQVHLWAVWHDLDGPEKLGTLALWRSWGVAGIKVDFMESESKDRYRWYDSVLEETARLGMMVNFHGSVIPRGWARTWPQVIGYEAIRGSEYYVFYQDEPLTPEHNVIQPFTRNPVGAMDYTPVAFGAPGRRTSDAHELSLSVAFECGITHFADDVDAYLSRPLVARFLAELAPAWEESLLIAGTPDTEAVVARRAGDRWFIGGVASGPARRLRVPLDRLGLGAARAWIVGDDPAGSGRGLVESTVAATDSFEVELAEAGGFVAIVAAENAELFRAAPRELLQAPLVTPTLVELDDNGEARLTVSPGARLRVAPGWSVRQEPDDRVVVRAPRHLEPGRLGVVTVELPGHDGVVRVAHARLVASLTAGEHIASCLPMIAFTNESGPVERDQSNGGGNPNDGQRMRVAGAEFGDGLGASTPSSADLFLGSRAARLTAAVGVDDETPGTRAIAVVSGDGRELATVRLEAGMPATAIDVDVSGVRILTLSTRQVADGDEPAHVDWASARVTVTSHDVTPDAGHR